MACGAGGQGLLAGVGPGEKEGADPELLAVGPELPSPPQVTLTAQDQGTPRGTPREQGCKAEGRSPELGLLPLCSLL